MSAKALSRRPASEVQAQEALPPRLGSQPGECLCPRECGGAGASVTGCGASWPGAWSTASGLSPLQPFPLVPLLPGGPLQSFPLPLPRALLRQHPGPRPSSPCCGMPFPPHLPGQWHRLPWGRVEAVLLCLLSPAGLRSAQGLGHLVGGRVGERPEAGMAPSLPRSWPAWAPALGIL